jgi:hypothetical protein
MAIAMRQQEIWKDKYGNRFTFNPLTCPILRTEERVGMRGLGSYIDIEGKEWDVYQIVGHVVWCTPKNTMQDWYYSTASNRGVVSSSPTSNMPESQQWNAYINITEQQDSKGILTPEDIYSDSYEYHE